MKEIHKLLASIAATATENQGEDLDLLDEAADSIQSELNELRRRLSAERLARGDLSEVSIDENLISTKRYAMTPGPFPPYTESCLCGCDSYEEHRVLLATGEKRRALG